MEDDHLTKHFLAGLTDDRQAVEKLHALNTKDFMHLLHWEWVLPGRSLISWLVAARRWENRVKLSCLNFMFFDCNGFIYQLFYTINTDQASKQSYVYISTMTFSAFHLCFWWQAVIHHCQHKSFFRRELNGKWWGGLPSVIISKNSIRVVDWQEEEEHDGNPFLLVVLWEQEKCRKSAKKVSRQQRGGKLALFWNWIFNVLDMLVKNFKTCDLSLIFTITRIARHN